MLRDLSCCAVARRAAKSQYCYLHRDRRKTAHEPSRTVLPLQAVARVRKGDQRDEREDRDDDEQKIGHRALLSVPKKIYPAMGQTPRLPGPEHDPPGVEMPRWGMA